MAENQDASRNSANLNIEVNAVANKKSAEQAVNELASGVQQASKKGRMEVPVDITVPIDNTKKKLTEAQKDITSELSKMMAKGFSASGKDIDTLTSKFDKFTKALDSAGKGRQNKIFREIRRQVEELQKAYKALRTETNSTKSYTPKATNTRKSTRKTAEDRYYDTQEQYSKRAQGATKREQYKGVETTGPQGYRTNSGVDAGKTNEYLMRLSEYSAHGSNWATELAKVLKEEIAKSAKTLVTYIDPNYKTKTKNGRATNEQEFLTATMKDVRKQLKKSIAQLEAGSEDITLDTLKEQAAVIKVLTRALGKTTEDAEKAISSAIQSRYSDSSNRRLGGTDLEEGQEKGVGPGHENTQKLVAELYKAMKQWDSEVFAEKMAKELILGIEKTNKRTPSQASRTIEAVQSSDTYKAELNRLTTATEGTFQSIRDNIAETRNVNRSVKIGNTKEAVEDDAAEKISKEHRDIDRDTARTVKKDAATGFNTDTKTDELIQLVASILSILQELNPSRRPTLPSGKDDGKTNSQVFKELTKAGVSRDQIERILADRTNARKGKTNTTRANIPTTPKALTGETEPYRYQVEKSNIYASPLRQGVWDSLNDAFEKLTGTTRDLNKRMSDSADEQDKMAAERVRIYGLNNGRNPNDTGDIAGMRRILQLYRTNKASIEQNPELAQKIQLTPGREIDTTEITKALNKALSGRQMQNAQNGGGFFQNFLGFATGGLGYAFMPSLEKSRAQADGLNQVLGNVNKALQSVIDNIQMKETELAGMEKAGDVKFNKEGFIEKGTSAAYKTLADLEEEKLVLDTIKADLLANDEVIKRTGGRYSSLVKQMKFTSPVLRENNDILRNITSGLDKNGKALKYQTRLAEILNYTFQLMSRSIGQMIKNWLSMLNPLNWIKRAFQDFGSYNVKWQRTMNVIQNNLREIILPFMDKIAQTLINIIGFLDIISMKIQEAFGYTPISLFDKRNAKEFKKTYEEIQNITASFDELHDIGSSENENDPNNLLGEIYEPQLSPAWVELANEIGDLFAGLIKGDLGFTEVMARILQIAWKGITTLWSEIIWPFIQNTIWPAIKDNWLEILGWILAAFLAWKGLKLIGSLLGDAISAGAKGILNWISTKLFGKPLFKTATDAGTTAGGLFGKALYTGMNGKMVTVGKLLGGITLTAGGTALAISQAADAGKNWEDLSASQKAVKVGLTGLGSVAAGVGAILLGATGPVGALVALGVAGVSAAVGMSQAQNGIGSLKEEQEELADVQNQLAESNQKLETSNNELDAAWRSLRDVEKEVGENGEELWNAVQQGRLTTEEMTDAQYKAYKAYQEVNKILKENTEIVKENNELVQSEAKETADVIFKETKDNGESYDRLAEHINTSWQSGIMSTETARDEISRCMGEMSETARQELLEKLDPALRQGLDYEKYQSGWNEFGRFWEELWTNAVGVHDASMANMKATEEDLTNTTNALTEAQNKLKEAQNQLTAAEQAAGMTWDELRTKLDNGSLSVTNLTEAQKALYQAHIDVANSSAVVDTALQNSGNVVVGLAKQAYQTSGDWKTFIDTLILANEEGTLSTEDMEREIGIALGEMDHNTEQLARNYLRSMDKMTNGVEEACHDQKGLFSTLWDDLKKGWESFWNWLGGKGWKSNAEIEIQNSAPQTTTVNAQGATLQMASFAVGTNYVPNDGLAYLHQGEAVIPKKYNQPYQPTGMTPEEQSYMRQMMNTLARLDTTIQQGINVSGEFRQRGSDLVATVKKAENRNGHQPLNNPVFAR